MDFLQSCIRPTKLLQDSFALQISELCWVGQCASMHIDTGAALSVPAMGAECARLLVMGGCTAEEVALTKARLMGKPQSLSVSRMKVWGMGEASVPWRYLCIELGYA